MGELMAMLIGADPDAVKGAVVESRRPPSAPRPRVPTPPEDADVSREDGVLSSPPPGRLGKRASNPPKQRLDNILTVAEYESLNSGGDPIVPAQPKKKGVNLAPVFSAFCEHQQGKVQGDSEGMDGKTFAKLCRDCQLVDEHC